jgi:adenylyl- and sulfurtransferase ThiI
MSSLSTTITSRHNKIQDLGRRIEEVTKKRGFKEFVERGKWILRKEERQELIASLHRYLGIFQLALSVDGL